MTSKFVFVLDEDVQLTGSLSVWLTKVPIGMAISTESIIIRMASQGWHPDGCSLMAPLTKLCWKNLQSIIIACN